MILERVRVGSVLVVAALACHDRATGTSIGPSAFGSAAVVESFEGIAEGPNAPLSELLNGRLGIGNVSPFAFSSGVVMTAPILNVHRDYPVLSNDFLRGDAFWNLVGNGLVTSPADVPFGTAYLSTVATAAPLAFQFPVDQIRVGIYATGLPQTTITLSAFDWNGGFLESATIDAVSVSNWATNFVGVENFAGIRSITLSVSPGAGDNRIPIYDGLTFEAAPEPPSFQALGILAGSILLCRRRFAGGRLAICRRPNV